MNEYPRSPSRYADAWAHLVPGQVWGYTRKSTKEEGGTNKSQESQAGAIIEACSDMGLPLPHVLHEQRGLSGALWWEGGGGNGVEGDPATKKRVRLGMTELVQAIVSGECKAIVVWGLDRLARHVGIMEALIELMNDPTHKCLLFDRNGPVDISTPEGRNSVRSTMMAAQFQRERAAVDAPRGIRTQRSKGKLVVPGNRVGFRSEGKATGIVRPVPEELAIVRRIFDLFVVGTPEQGPLSIHQITQVLMDDNVRWMEEVGQYKRRSKRRAGEFTIYPATIYAILRDCAYQGRQKHAGQEWTCNAFLIEGEPAIPTWLFEAAGEKLGAKRSYPKQKSRPFTRIVKCGICGVTMRMNQTSFLRAEGSTETVPALMRASEKIGTTWKCGHYELPVIHLHVLLEYTREHLAPLLVSELTVRAQAGDRLESANRKASLCRKLKDAEQRLLEELPRYLGKVSPEMLGAMEREARIEVEGLRNQLRALDDETLHMERLRASLEDFGEAPMAVQREIIERLFHWVAVIPSGLERGHPDRGRIVFLTRWHTFHTGFIFREPKQASSRCQNYHQILPATIGQAVGGIGDFPDPETFVAHLERSYQAASIPFDIETVVPGYHEWKEGGIEPPVFTVS